MQKDWSDTITHWLATARGLEEEGQYGLAKYARASAEAVARRAAYHASIANDRETLVKHTAQMEREMTALEVPTEIREALGRGRAAMETGKLTLFKDTPNPYLCRTCGNLVLGTPTAICAVCGAHPRTFLKYMPNYWFDDMDPFELLEWMRTTPHILAGLLEGLTEEQMTRQPADGGWSIHQAITHYRDTQDVMAFRVNLILDKDNPPLESLAIFEWAGKEQEKPATTREIYDAYSKSRNESIATLENIPLKAWWRMGQHQEFGPLTLRQQVSYFIAHEITHLPQIEALRK
ncbi:MAG: DinB family protein [Anaerolineae bacterium]|nr:DinB family protein [Anaerolineae bacterium]